MVLLWWKDLTVVQKCIMAHLKAREETNQLGRNARRRLTNHESTRLGIKVCPVPIGQCLLQFSG